MDPQTILIGIAIFIISAFLIYFIAAVTMREKTFEEVMAEQKRRQEEERERVKNDKKIEKELLKKKFKKGKGDKSKEKSAQVSEPELKDSPEVPPKEHKMVNLELEPEIIEPYDSMVLGSNQPRNRSGTQKKSILHNKDEATPVTEKAVELPHKPIKPLDDLELKKLHDIQTHEAAIKKERGRQQVEPKQEVTESVKVQKVKSTRVEAVEVQQNVAVEEKKVSKSKAMEVQQSVAVEEKKVTKSKSAAAVESTSAQGARIIDTVRTAHLTDREVQLLIEILLNHQGASATAPELWNKKSPKGDPLAVMRKHLEEKERVLQEEQQLALSANNRVKELRSELAEAKNKLSSTEKQLRDKLEQQSAEFEAIQARLRHAHEQHMNETTKLQAHIQQLEKSGDAALVQKLKQENRILQDSLTKASAESVPAAEMNNLRHKVSIMEKELSSNAVRLNASENAKKSLEDKLRKYEEQIKKLDISKRESEDVLGKKLDKLNGELHKAESKVGTLTSDLKKATGALSSAESECTTLKSKLQELEKHLSAFDANKDMGVKLQESERKNQELEGNVKNLEMQFAEVVRRHDDMKMELQQIRQENLMLTQEIKVTKEKQEIGDGDGLQAAPNGDIHKENASKNVIHLAEHERILSEKMDELAKLEMELEVQRSSASQITELKAQLDTQKQKNNELREKNWKAMEALEKAEKLAAEKIDKTLKSSKESVTKAVTELEQMDKEVLKRLFPAVNVTGKLEHKDWLAVFEKQAVQYMAHTSHEQNTEKEKLQHLEEENQRLKSSSQEVVSLSEEVSRLQEEKQDLQSRLVEKENNITEAERKLHNLEEVVEKEEKKWKEKLQQAEETLNRNQQTNSESTQREQELEELTIEQQTQIEHYRSVLSNTESVLLRLETEEKTREEKLQMCQAELRTALAECQRLQTELRSQVDVSEKKIEGWRQELRLTTESITQLNREKEELTSKVIVLETQSKAVVQVDNEDLRKQLEEVHSQLQAERKKNKDLSSTLVRLNGIIKTGQDALSQEQQLVKQLHDQLTEKSKGAGTTDNQETEQLRIKLSEKDKQLEREIAANKQLSQRLNTSGNDQGTSV